MLPLAEIRANRFALPAMGRSVFSPVFVENLVDGVLLATSPVPPGQVYVLSDGVGVTTKEFFGHYFRMLGKQGPICLPSPVALALARLNEFSYRFRDGTTEVNPDTIHYMTRRGTYSIEKGPPRARLRTAGGARRGDGPDREMAARGKPGLIGDLAHGASAVTDRK